jgi:hypothetical protein
VNAKLFRNFNGIIAAEAVDDEYFLRYRCDILQH